MEKKQLVIFVVLVLIGVFIGGFILKFVNENYFRTDVKSSEEDEEQLVGGCGGVYYEYWNECCENWAEENKIVTPACVGSWTVENNKCSWICD